MRSILLVMAFASVHFAGTVHAASVTAEAGNLHVNRGEGFVAIEGATELPVGAQVMVSPGGSALISYGSCQVRVGSNRVWAVQEKAPCASGSTFVDFTGRMGNATAEESSGINGTTILVGLGVIGGVAAAIALSNDDDDDKKDKCVSVC